MQNQLIGITVSYQYDDCLKHCLPNTQQLDYWYIVVDKNDTPTIELLKDIPNVIMVYFDFKEGGSVFNKSGGLRKAQEIVHAKYPDAWVLLLDSDILLPKMARMFMDIPNKKTDFIYGAHRVFYNNLSDLNNDMPVCASIDLVGFFHLYFDKQKFCMERSHSTAVYDDHFMKQFVGDDGNLKMATVPIVVKHLGHIGLNVNGRVSIRFE